MDIYEVLIAVDERNRAEEMALKHAISILEDFRELSPAGRSMMADALMELISGDGKN